MDSDFSERGDPDDCQAPVSMRWVLDHLLTRMEQTHELRQATADDQQPLRISTGIVEFDHVLAGGVAPGEVVVVAANAHTLAESISVSVARGCPTTVLVAARDLVTFGRLMLASEAAVPERLLKNCQMSFNQWNRINCAVGRLAELDLRFTSVTGTRGLEAACDGDARVLVIDGAERYGPLPLVLSLLDELARERGVAVLAVTTTSVVAAKADAGPSSRVIAVVSSGVPGRAVTLETDTLSTVITPTDPATASFGTRAASPLLQGRQEGLVPKETAGSGCST